ncbi:MAG: sigma-70 family RNA polymerase sigma factor [Pirellulaceae bacterium]|nr:sigma-70 family RNA polymerase sigma factor [Pirellulaceae bacterium]
MALSDIDRRLLERCLAREPRSWEDFVDRFIGLMLHVVNHTSQVRGHRLTDEDREDLVAEICVVLIQDDFSVLRRFRGDSSLATYLTVIARRVVVRQLQNGRNAATLKTVRDSSREDARSNGSVEQRISNQEELSRLLSRLDGAEADVVRMYHLEGKSYREISSVVGMPENSIGPTLSRARTKLRQARADA